MSPFFKKKSPIEKLEKRYAQLLSEAHKLSTSSRTMSDQKIGEAQAILEEIDRLKSAKKQNHSDEQ